MSLNAIRIDDPGDPRLAPYRAVRERDLVGRDGHFVAEGEVVLGRLVVSPLVRAHSLLLFETRLPRLTPLLDQLDADVPVYVAGRDVIDRVIGFPLHRGVLAIGSRRAAPSVRDLLAACPERALVVAAIGLANHDNLGGIFRNAAAFGADAVLLDRSCCDPLYRKAIRVSVGATLGVPFARGGSPQDVLDDLIRAGFEPIALSPAGREDIGQAAFATRTALVLGTEGPGLPDAILARARSVRVPIAAGFDSLNVATASGIALHAARTAIGSGRP